jgi:cell division protein FtsL
MHREERVMTRRGRPRPTRPPSRLVPAVLAIAIAAVGFAMLMVRLEAIREGYRLSALRLEIAKLEDEHRKLGLKVAELSSHERLRALAPVLHLGPPQPGQVVMMP